VESLIPTIYLLGRKLIAKPDNFRPDFSLKLCGTKAYNAGPLFTGQLIDSMSGRIREYAKSPLFGHQVKS